VARVRLLWILLLLAPAGVVFVAARTAIDPISSAERLDVGPHAPATIVLPTAVIGITKPAQPRAVERPKARVPRSPRSAHFVPPTVVTHIVGTTTLTPPASHTPSGRP
jgi:hypothetical protein